MKAILKKHPEIDFFIGLIGGSEIPTKQDKFKPFSGYKIVPVEKGKEKIDLLYEYDLYVKKKGTSEQSIFEENLKKEVKKLLTNEHPYKKDIMLEVIICISMKERRKKNK